MHLIAPQDLIRNHLLTAEATQFIDHSRKAIRQLVSREDPRLLIIVGPCSIHNVEEGLFFAEQLKKLSKEVEKHCFLVMRAYIEKPRTRQGWRGLVHDPHLNGSHDLAQGLVLSRSFLQKLAEMHVPAAVEFLTPSLAPYFQDLVSWGCIGARTASSPIHRLLASDLPMPVGFKNSVDGNIDCAINGVHVARGAHTFLHTCESGKVCVTKSKGNPYAHIVLRGSKAKPNYDRVTIQQALAQLRQLELPPRLLIDCSHGNCEGHYFKQKQVFRSVLEQIQEGNQQIIGMMLESHLHASSQSIPNQLGDLQSGVSITDPCLDFSMTAELISSISSSVQMSLTQS